ncbi:hypothetical protein [Pseudarthrobacter sulfonivorans]|uniref:hypothetical protein n=1 Tax=Pseudarthrobacter sulfonivorans TaxID=121292 RepID=UPI00168AFA46|nr:hypothetical protein [Pseudarthrobacter sulfonivorans]
MDIAVDSLSLERNGETVRGLKNRFAKTTWHKRKPDAQKCQESQSAKFCLLTAAASAHKVSAVMDNPLADFGAF